jgi:hypothetical protein
VSDGRQTEAGEHDAQRRGKVVRLPRDWLGPREELIPFGPRAASIEADEAPPSSEDPLPSPADFWGEQSAAIQSAVQAPAAPEGGIDGSLGAHAIRVARVDRRAVAGCAAVVAIVAVLVGALVSSSPGPRGAPHPAGASNIGFAAVLSAGVSRILRLDLGRVDAARVAPTTVRHTPHRESAPKRPHRTARPRPTQSVHIAPHVVAATTPSYRRVSTYTSDATNAGGTDTHSETPPATRSAPAQSPSRPVASRATVPATGESGALGPIQSPNG